MPTNPVLTGTQRRWLSVLKLGSGIVSANSMPHATARALRNAGYIQPHTPASCSHRFRSRSEPKPEYITWKITEKGADAIEGPGNVPPLAYIGLAILLGGGSMFDNAVVHANTDLFIDLDPASEALLAAITSPRGDARDGTNMYQLDFERLRGTRLYDVLDAQTKPRTASRV